MYHQIGIACLLHIVTGGASHDLVRMIIEICPQIMRTGSAVGTRNQSRSPPLSSLRSVDVEFAMPHLEITKGRRVGESHTKDGVGQSYLNSDLEP
jgi:replicative DNA helicase